MGCDAIVGMKDEAAVISDKVRRTALPIKLLTDSLIRTVGSQVSFPLCSRRKRKIPSRMKQR